VTLLATPPEQEGAFARGDLDGAFTCGLPYVRHYAPPADARPLASMVMAAERYGGQPVYFSDLIVPAASPFQHFDDLRGATLAYNQVESFSGYVLLRHYLRTRGLDLNFFGAQQATGSHAASLDWVLSGRADLAAIDSVVLDMELRLHPERAAQFRVVASLGPMPMPPVVVSARLDSATHTQLSQALTTMHLDPAGQAILAGSGVRRFAPIADQDYDPIRDVARIAGLG
jgi:phosphonate transport system substrate-binding protein